MSNQTPSSGSWVPHCTSCAGDLRNESPPADGRCPYCGGTLALVGEGRALRAVVRALKTGRSGLIAASLLSATTVIGCGDGTPGAEASEKDTVQVTDVVSDTELQADTAADIPAIPPYGIPPEDIRETEDAAMPMDTAPDIPAVPPYGIPPEDIQEPRDTEAPPKDITSDAGSSPDADDVADAKPQPDTAPDTVPVPPYGIPPEQD